MTDMRWPLSAFLGLVLLAQTAPAGFHVMQIEEVIGGVNGDPTAQAIQLRMRTGGQTFVSAARLMAWDSTGTVPTLLLNITSDVSNGGSPPGTAGATILLTTTAFNTLMSGVPGYAPDFTLAKAIPVTDLNAGKITFEGDDGTVYWTFAFGGSNYTGTTPAANINGTFGSPFASPLPTDSIKGVFFTGSATAASTNNATQYAFITGAPHVENNANAIFTVVPEPSMLGLLSCGAAGLAGLLGWRRRHRLGP